MLQIQTGVLWPVQMAHVAAAAGPDRDELLGQSDALKPNIAVITAYNDMLSAHQPFENYHYLSAQRLRGGQPHRWLAAFGYV